MGTNLNRRWKKMIALGDQALSTKHQILQFTVPNRNDPARRYTNYKKPRQDDHDIIFELLQTEERLSVAIPLRRARQTGRLDFQIREQLLASAWDNSLDLEALSQTAEGGVVTAKLSSLMEKTNTTREDWAQDGALYQLCRRSVALKKIRSIQTQIIQVITDRTIELDILHRRTRGHKQAKKVITRINSRWRQLDKLVKNFNQETARINVSGQDLGLGDLQLRKVSTQGLRERGIDCDELWDVDRMLSTADWAKYSFVREGIESCFLLKRITKEHDRLQLHSMRMCRWLQRQCNVLFQNLNSSNVNISHDALKLLLFERYKVVDNMLKIKNDGLLSLQRKKELQGLQLQIADILKPIPVPPPPSVPAVSEEEEVKGEDEETMEAIEDELLEAHGYDLEEEVAARIMMQDEIDGGNIDDGIGSVDDFGNESELLQDLDFDN
ncbi:hypothetical protein BDD12DRAFT_810352 [Trichophaea hybrida]|nr:hypothetical protein BDD12DRAFT_810352 [Trichophaea hybrida]